MGRCSKAAAIVKDVVAAGEAVEAPGSRKTPRTAATGKLSQEKQPTATPATAAMLVSPASNAPQTARSLAYEVVNRPLGPSGQRIETLGSDALQRCARA